MGKNEKWRKVKQKKSEEIKYSLSDLQVAIKFVEHRREGDSGDKICKSKHIEQDSRI